MNNYWDIYANRLEIQGATKHDATLKREARTLIRKLPENLSFQSVIIYDHDHGYNITSDMVTEAKHQDVAIINSDNLDEKYIYSQPGEDREHGGLINWMDNFWLVSERDANTTLYTRAKLIQCNYLLKWVSDSGKIIEQWCKVTDGTKYLTGEFEDRNFVVTRGDSRLSVVLARNGETAKLGRSNRFLIDDPLSGVKLAYSLTKPFKLSNVYNEKGVFAFVLQEVQTTELDNQELGIADYYKYYPRIPEVTDPKDPIIDTDNVDPETGKKVWL